MLTVELWKKNIDLFHWNDLTLVQKGFSFWDSLNLTWANSRKEHKGRHSDSTNHTSHVQHPLCCGAFLGNILDSSFTAIICNLTSSSGHAWMRKPRTDVWLHLFPLVSLHTKINTHSHMHSHTNKNKLFVSHLPVISQSVTASLVPDSR